MARERENSNDLDMRLFAKKNRWIIAIALFFLENIR